MADLVIHEHKLKYKFFLNDLGTVTGLDDDRMTQVKAVILAKLYSYNKVPALNLTHI